MYLIATSRINQREVRAGTGRQEVRDGGGLILKTF